RDLHRDGGEEVVGVRQLAVHAADQPALPALVDDETEAEQGGDDEVAADILEREYVGLDRLVDDDRLDAAHVADFPILLGALGCELWQATHTCPISTGAASRMLRSNSVPLTS